MKTDFRNYTFLAVGKRSDNKSILDMLSYEPSFDITFIGDSASLTFCSDSSSQVSFPLDDILTYSIDTFTSKYYSVSNLQNEICDLHKETLLPELSLLNATTSHITNSDRLTTALIEYVSSFVSTPEFKPDIRIQIPKEEVPPNEFLSNTTMVFSYTVRNIPQMLLSVLRYTSFNHRHIRKCNVCGKYFFPIKNARCCSRECSAIQQQTSMRDISQKQINKAVKNARQNLDRNIPYYYLPEASLSFKAVLPEDSYQLFEDAYETNNTQKMRQAFTVAYHIQKQSLSEEDLLKWLRPIGRMNAD